MKIVHLHGCVYSASGVELRGSFERGAEVRERDSSIDDFMLRVKPQVMELLPEKVVFFRLRSFERNCSCYKIEEPNFLAFKK